MLADDVKGGKNTKVVFFAMTAKGLAVINHVISSRKEVVYAVVGARDEAVKDDSYDEIRTVVGAHGIPHFDRREFDAAVINREGLIGVAISWRWLIGSSNLIVLHDSLLPKYRGFNPLVSALINGEKKVGVTAIVASEEFDRGRILLQRALNVVYPIKVNEAIKKLSVCYVSIVDELLAKLSNGSAIPSTEQNEAEATYSLWRDDEDYRIDWNQSAEQIARKVDAVGFPYAGASTLIDGGVFRIHDVEVLPDLRIENRVVGKVLKIDHGCPIIVCGHGLLKIIDMHDESKGTSALPFPTVRLRLR